MDDSRYEILLLKYASNLAYELGERARRLFEYYSLDLLPDPKVVKRKRDLERNKYIYMHGSRNLLPALCRCSLVPDPNPKLIEAYDEFYKWTSYLTEYMVPLEYDKNEDYESDDESTKESQNDLVEVYLVNESCLVQIDKARKTNFVQVEEKSKYEELMKYVIRTVDCYESMNIALTEKEHVYLYQKFKAND